MHKALFLDRDGVLNVDHGYTHLPEQSKIIKGAAEIISAANALGWKTVVVSNQSGIGRGYFDSKDFEKFMNWIKEEIRKDGAYIDAVYFCPHLPEDEKGAGCLCRKPKSGLIELAATELGLSLSDSVLIGDQASDLEAGLNAGVGRLFLIQAITDGNSGPTIPREMIEEILFAIRELG